MAQQALLNLGAPHHAAGGNLFKGLNPIGCAALFGLIESAQNRPCKGITDDYQIGDFMIFDHGQQLVWIESEL